MILSPVYVFIAVSLLSSSISSRTESLLNKTSSQSTVAIANDTSPHSCVKPKHYLPDVYYINLEQSIDRRKYMVNQLKFYGFIENEAFIDDNRIQAITSKQFILPDEISSPKLCQRLSTSNINDIITSSKNSGNITDRSRILVTTHCGRPKNTRRELAVTLSHLFAIRKATLRYPDDTANRYALILEDDMEIAFDIDYELLIASAPKGFGILQLVTSNSYDITQLWKQYKLSGYKDIWTLRTYHDFWCAGAYLIDKLVLKPIINGIITSLKIVDHFSFISKPKRMNESWYGVNVIAGYDKPCTPSWCCQRRDLLKTESPCVRAPRGYQADHFLFSLTEGASYMINIPIITGARSGNRSTLHQDHVNIHIEAFRRINTFIDEIILGDSDLTRNRSELNIVPSFIVNAQCRFDSHKFWLSTAHTLHNTNLTSTHVESSGPSHFDIE